MRGNPTHTEIQKLPIAKLKPYEAHPYKVLCDESMLELAESIKSRGVLNPIVVRPKENDTYEILSGHRRTKACEIAGIEKIPAKIINLNDDMAAIYLVDSNIQRENLLPSEKAYAYKLKLDAMKRQGLRTDLTSSQIGTKFRADETLAKQAGESRNQIQRYIRLTNLTYQLLEKVDEKVLPLNAAVELSYLGSKAQSYVAEIMECDEMAPSVKQAARIRELSTDGTISEEKIAEVLQERVPEKMKIVIKDTSIREYFPHSYTKDQIEHIIMKLIQGWAERHNHTGE